MRRSCPVLSSLLLLAVSGAGCSTDGTDPVDSDPPSEDDGPAFGPDLDCGPEVLPANTGGLLRRFPYLQDATRDGMTIAWGTPETSGAVLHWGPDVDLGRTIRSSEPIVITDLNPTMALHHARVTGLEPGTAYCYAIEVDGEIRASGLQFRTAPRHPDTTVKVVVMGDYGNGSDAQAELRDVVLKMASEQRIDLWLTTGDNAYGDGRHDEFQRKVFEVYQRLWHRIPVFTTPGNHDWGSVAADKDDITPYVQNFFLPEHGNVQDHPESYYSLDFGPIHWTGLDSHFEIGDSTTTGSPITRLTEAPDDDMIDWATADVAEVGDRWRIAGWHHPAYSGQLDRAPELHVVLELLPWAEATGVDLILNGPNHLYERFSHLEGGVKKTEGGQTWIVTGGGGAGPYEIGPHDHRDAGESVNHFLWLEVSRCTIEGKAIAGDERVIDTFTMTRCAE